MRRIETNGARFRFTPEYLAQQGGAISAIETPRQQQIANMKAELRLPLTAARRRDLNGMLRDAIALERYHNG